MIGYILAYDGITFNEGFGQNRISLQRSVSPARARVLGGKTYDLDGLYTYPAEQTYTADLADRNGEFIAKPLYQRLGKYGWLTAITRASTPATVVNWAKLVSIDAQATAGQWLNIGSERNIYKLTFACSPFWYDPEDSTVALSGSTGFTFSNNGNARSTWWQLTITSAITTSLTMSIYRNTGATYGVAIYGEAFYDGSTSQSLTYAASKAARISLTIDARNNSVSLSTGAANPYANITLPNTQSGFGYLSPTSNRIVFSSAVTGTFLYRGAYV